MYFDMCSCFIYVFYLVFVEHEGVEHIKMGGKFLLPEYGVFILPRNGTTVAFSTSTVLHCTNVAHSYDNIGMSYSTKWNVQKTTTRTK